MEQIGNDDLLSSARAVAGVDHKLRFLTAKVKKLYPYTNGSTLSKGTNIYTFGTILRY